ncbi:radical SAM family heme chaperone HemW [Candidatus Cyanaurora vandensis]|nr:radical SAM family heme chaperone HemW [Candidatus Cyanaurora vandensis]
MTTIQIIDPTSSPTLREWPSALYLHIPFCPTHCHYCDFAVTVGTTSLIEQYVQYLLQEIELTPSQGQPLASVYFGGGTPSLLTPQQLERILLALDHHFHIAKTAEITLEANPGTLNKRTLTTFQHLGINRISLGVQTFDETMLKRLGRNHTVQDTYEAVDAIRRAGFTNLSLDLMFGLPEQTLANWQTSLTSALALAPEHISAYDLILEPTTPFGRAFQSGCAPLPTEEATITMYLDLI